MNLRGLSDVEAAARLRRWGPNELRTGGGRSLFRIGWQVASEPMFVLLVASGAVYLLIGGLRDALALLGFVFVVMGLTMYQERKTERALAALRDLSSPRAIVIRGGVQKRVPGREVVPGDLIVLTEGDRVPADGVLRASTNLTIDESILTGESVPVRKRVAAGAAGPVRPGGDDQPFVFSGTLIVGGQGMADVQATGERTAIGGIGEAVRGIRDTGTPLGREVRQFVRRMAGLGLAICLLLAVAYGLTRGDWLNGLLASLTLAMAVLPEELPVVLTVVLALGAWRLSRQQVLARRIPAVETLGAATVLCVDKTGTLTLNRMSVRALVVDGRRYVLEEAGERLPDACHELLEFAILAGHRHPFDPMERAFTALGDRTLAGTEHIDRDWTLVREYPLSDELLAMSRVWRATDGNGLVVAAKGAPEAIVDLCHLEAPASAAVEALVRGMADEGLRVLGVARSRRPASDLPGGQHDFPFEFLGLIGLADPIRPTAAPAVAECREAGIRVVMMTGDYPATARRIALEIGLPTAGGTLTGAELDALSDEALRARAATVDVFARVLPEQKLRLVQALKADGEVVAMTGDGVNDAPALKAAHIGIAMGERGTDVAREAADLVLLDDDFSSIVRAVRLGRRVFDNLKKAMAYVIAVHVPIIGMSLLPVLLGWPLVLRPVHVAFLELIIDPASSLVFEAEPGEPDSMRRPPRDPRDPLFGWRMLALSLLQGGGALAVAFAVFGLALLRGDAAGDARALTFTTLVLCNLGLIFSNRSRSRSALATLRSANRMLGGVTGGALGLLAAVLYVPALRALFGFSTLHAADLGICLAAAAVSVAWSDLVKVRIAAAGAPSSRPASGGAGSGPRAV